MGIRDNWAEVKEALSRAIDALQFDASHFKLLGEQRSGSAEELRAFAAYEPIRSPDGKRTRRNLEAELLFLLLDDPKKIAAVKDHVKPEDFHDPRLRNMYLEFTGLDPIPQTLSPTELGRTPHEVLAWLEISEIDFGPVRDDSVLNAYIEKISGRPMPKRGEHQSR